MEELKTFHIDVDKGIYEVNGKDISKTVTRLQLTYENGKWSLELDETSVYSTRDHY